MQGSGAGSGGRRGGTSSTSSLGEGLYLAEDDQECTGRMRSKGEFWEKLKHECRGVKAIRKFASSLWIESRECSVDRDEDRP